MNEPHFSPLPLRGPEMTYDTPDVTAVEQASRGVGDDVSQPGPGRRFLAGLTVAAALGGGLAGSALERHHADGRLAAVEASSADLKQQIDDLTVDLRNSQATQAQASERTAAELDRLQTAALQTQKEDEARIAETKNGLSTTVIPTLHGTITLTNRNGTQKYRDPIILVAPDLKGTMVYPNDVPAVLHNAWFAVQEVGRQGDNFLDAIRFDPTSMQYDAPGDLNVDNPNVYKYMYVQRLPVQNAVVKAGETVPYAVYAVAAYSESPLPPLKYPNGYYQMPGFIEGMK